MSQLTCQFVRPDKLLYEGAIDHVILQTRSGELGVWPGHASEICALGTGVVRITTPESEGKEVKLVAISGGYAEIDDDTVIILADHARSLDDIEPDVVEETRESAISARDELPQGDHRRAYYDSKIKWCDLLLSLCEEHAE